MPTIDELPTAHRHASSIASQINWPHDQYHENIWFAAMRLCNAGMGGYRYLTQHDSGATLWCHPDEGPAMRISVTPDGRITH